MSIATFLQKVGASVGNTSGAKFRRSYTIDDGCKGLFDFSKKWGYPAQVTPVVTGSKVRAYPRAATDTTISGTPAWSGGMLRFTAKGQQVNLPSADFNFPANTQEFLVGGMFKIPLTGHGTGTASSTEYFTNKQTNGANVQYGLTATFDASGNITNAYAAANAANFQVLPYIPTDGAVHQYAIGWKVISSNTWRLIFYVDGVAVYASSAQTYSGTLIQSGQVLALGCASNSNLNYANFSCGRFFSWRPDLTGSKTALQVLAAELALVNYGGVPRFT